MPADDRRTAVSIDVTGFTPVTAFLSGVAGAE